MSNGGQEHPKPAPPPAPAAKPAAKPKAAAAPAQSFIYVGPTLPPAMAPLPQYICFAREIPKQLDGVFKQCPAIRELIVPTADLARARLAMAQPGTREHSFSVAVQKFIAAPVPTSEE